MKKINLVILILFTATLAGCSGVSQSDYQKVSDEKVQLEAKVESFQTQINELEAKAESLQTESNKLQTQLDIYKSDNSTLKSTLTTTYDAYRYMMLYVTTEVYGNTLSKSEWEAYIAKNDHPAPTFDEVNKLLSK
jgi:hypothetical protein